MPQTPEAVMSYSLWQRLFGGDPSVVGRTVRLNGIPFTIIGVAPKGFAGTFVGFNIEMWVPLEMAALVAPRLDLVSRHADRLEWVARVRPGLDVRKVRSELQTIAARLRRQYPEANRELKAEVTTVTGIDEEFRAGVIGFLGVMIAVGLMVLLIASLNVVNMMLARAAGRSREMAVRLALGASRRRLLAQLLSEHLILGLAAGTGGLVFAWMSSRLLSQWSPSLPLPISINLTPDWRVVMAAFVLSVLIAVWIGMLTALRSTRPQLVQALKEGGGRGSTASRPRGLLVTAQIAVSMVLLVCAGLFIRTLHYADRAEVGFNTEGVQVSPLLEPSLLRMNPEEARRFYVQLYQRLKNLPGSRSASLVGRLPLSFFGSSTAVVLSPGTDSSAPREELKYDFTVVSPGYFETLQIPFKAGRDFGLEDEMDSAAAAVVSEAFARRFWPHRDELGQTFSADGRQIRVVGVVGDVKQNSLSEVAEPFFYVPFTQHPSARMAIVTRSAQSSAALSRAVRSQVEEIAAGLPVSEFTPVKDFLAISLIAQRLAGGAAALLGVIGLILAAAGLYGLISYSVTQRKAEFGIRYSLGARQSDVLRLVVRGGLKLTLAGLLLGGVLALGTTRFLESLLYGISPRDPLTFLAIALLLTATTLLASYLPVRKAAAVDPAQALRSE